LRNPPVLGGKLRSLQGEASPGLTLLYRTIESSNVFFNPADMADTVRKLSGRIPPSHLFLNPSFRLADEHSQIHQDYAQKDNFFRFILADFSLA
jgi:hypothetical protein